MVAPLVIGGIMGAGAIAGGIGGMKASKAAKRAAYEQAALYEMQYKEQMRRTARQQAEQLGITKAGVYASGVQMSGSMEAYTQAMAAEQRRQLAWMEKAGRQQVRAIKKGARVQAQADKWNIAGGVIGGIAGAFGTGYSMKPPAGGGQGGWVSNMFQGTSGLYTDYGGYR